MARGHTETLDEGHQRSVLFEDGVLPDGVPIDALDRRRIHLEFGCGGGRRIVGDWIGVPVFDIVEAAGAPGSATHILVDAHDDSRACVPLERVLGALLALDEQRVGDVPTSPPTPRLVGEHIGSLRSLKRVRRIETLRLSSREDAAEFERLRG